MRHGETMRYLATTAAQRAEMLRTIGVGDVEALIERIPSKARLGRDLAIPAALAEGELIAHLRGLAERNADADRYVTLPRGRRLRPLHPERDQPHAPARRVLHRVHALPAGGEPGDAAVDLRVPDHDLRADRHGRDQRLPLRRRLGPGRGRAHGAQRDGAGADRGLRRAVAPGPAGRGDVLRGAAPAGEDRAVGGRRHGPRRPPQGGDRQDRVRHGPVPELLRVPGGPRPGGGDRPRARARCSS